MKKSISFILCSLLFVFASCIKNDIPYPLIKSNITAFEVEGMCTAPDGSGPVIISKSDRTVHVYVVDTVNVSNLKVTRFTTDDTNPTTIITVLDSARCKNYDRFPRKPFASLAECYTSANTRIDFSDEANPVRFRLTTYQDYDWSVTVHQIIKRLLLVENQVGDAVIDEINHNVVIYVTPETNLKRLHVTSFTLGGEHGSVLPDPTGLADGFDFSREVLFYVRRGFEETSTEWSVHVYHKESGKANCQIFPMSVRARVSGTMQMGKSLTIEYRESGQTQWQNVDNETIESNGLTFSSTLEALKPNTQYQLRLTSGDTVGDVQDFTTAPAPALNGGSFDDWCTIKESGHSRDTYCPWPDGAESFWDTGNHGATTVGASNSIPTDETCNGSGQAAYLESKYIVIKFAAGNIFTGVYKETDGTNGILDFGRPFTGFPSKLRVNYKCNPQIINKCNSNDYKHLVGRPDTCQIYIALADWDKPLEIRTRPSNLSVFNPDDSHVIAYGQISKGDAVESWTQEDIVLNYRYTDRTPKYILIVASSSKYGDYFTGGEGSELWVDNFELIYD